MSQGREAAAAGVGGTTNCGGKVATGAATVFINGKSAARMGDTANTCNDPADTPVGTVIAAGTVFVGG